MMASLFIVSIQDVRIGQPVEGISDVVILFLFLLLIRTCLFIARRTTRAASPASPEEIPFHQAIQKLERQFLECDIPSSQSAPQ